MKTRDLLEEIKENIKDYNIEIFENKANDEKADQASKQRAIFHIQNYNEIISSHQSECPSSKCPKQIYSFLSYSSYFHLQ